MHNRMKIGIDSYCYPILIGLPGKVLHSVAAEEVDDIGRGVPT